MFVDEYQESQNWLRREEYCRFEVCVNEEIMDSSITRAMDDGALGGEDGRIRSRLDQEGDSLSDVG